MGSQDLKIKGQSPGHPHISISPDAGERFPACMCSRVDHGSNNAMELMATVSAFPALGTDTRVESSLEAESVADILEWISCERHSIAG
jgi:hypothetical protein